MLVKRAGVSPVRAIQAATMTNAEALGWQDQIGSIEKGKYADLVVIGEDPLTCPAERLRDAEVLATIVGGKLVSGRLP